MIYLASPYSHKLKGVELLRYIEAQKLVSGAFMAGLHVISPIVHWHEVAIQFGMPTDAEAYSNYNDDLIRSCESVWVATFDGWDISKGVTYEIEFARRLQKPIYFGTTIPLLAGDFSHDKYKGKY